MGRGTRNDGTVHAFSPPVRYATSSRRTAVVTGAPRSFQSGNSSSSARGSNTLPDRMWAPISEPFSTTTTLSSRPLSRASCPRRHAAARPLGPPPTITTSNSIDSRSTASVIVLLPAPAAASLADTPCLLPASRSLAPVKLPRFRVARPEDAPMDLISLWRRKAAELGLEPDPAQHAALEVLEALRRELETRPARASKLRRLLDRGEPRGAPRGVYLWGGVGRGKTLLMNAFFEALSIERKRRVHFHRFMGEVHDRLARLRDRRDPLDLVASGIAGEAAVLCFDEFFVGDIG